MSRLSDPRWPIARRELSSLSREKTIVLAILIQLFIAAFSSFLVVGLTSMYDPDSVEGGEIEVAVTGETQEKLLRATRPAEGITAVPMADRESALAAFDRGEVQAVLTGSTAETPDGSQVQVDAVVPAGDLQTTLVVVELRAALLELERLERQDRAAHLEFVPVELPPEVEASPYFGFTYTILLPLLLFLPAFISGSIVVDSISEERARETLELLRAAPVSLVEVVDGKALGMIALAPAQAALWIALLRLNGIGVANGSLLLLFVTAVATVTVVVGAVLALLTAQRREAQLLYSVLTLGLFAGAVALPEHPATTVALLAVDSATLVTLGHVWGSVVVAVLVYLGMRMLAERIDPETL